MSGGTTPLPGNQKPVQGPRESKYPEQKGDRPAGLQAGQKRREGTPQKRPSCSLSETTSPYSDSGFRGADPREFPRRAEHSKFSATASAGPRARLKYSEEWEPMVRRF